MSGAVEPSPEFVLPALGAAGSAGRSAASASRRAAASPGPACARPASSSPWARASASERPCRRSLPASAAAVRWQDRAAAAPRPRLALTAEDDEALAGELARAARDGARVVDRAGVEEQARPQVVAEGVEAVDGGHLVEGVVEQALDAAALLERLEHLPQRLGDRLGDLAEALEVLDHRERVLDRGGADLAGLAEASPAPGCRPWRTARARAAGG